MSEAQSEPFVTSDHLIGFGAVIHNYAMAEVGLKVALACLLGIDIVDLIILAEPYSSASLGNVARSIAKTNEPVSAASTEVIGFANRLQGAAGLRNAIAHDRWTIGEREGSIIPARLDIRQGKPVVKGIVGTDRDWTADELCAAADDLARLNSDVASFMLHYGCNETTVKEPLLRPR